MEHKHNIIIRLQKLQRDIEEINKRHEDTQRDANIDCGIVYNKPEPYTEETIKRTNEKLRKAEALEKQRQDLLFDSLFNFSQTFLSLKDYLKKTYPEKEKLIEDFFSNRVDGLTRKKIGTDLKHNPSEDLEIRKRDTEIKSFPTKKIITVYNEKVWYYGNIDSVKYCNALYNEFKDFLRINNF